MSLDTAGVVHCPTPSFYALAQALDRLQDCFPNQRNLQREEIFKKFFEDIKMVLPLVVEYFPCFTRKTFALVGVSSLERILQPSRCWHPIFLFFCYCAIKVATFFFRLKRKKSSGFTIIKSSIRLQAHLDPCGFISVSSDCCKS